ncbi:MAG: hypothetical protein ABI400_10675 [Lacisediminihabitans sp.]
MTITDWSTDIALLALVFLQLRARKLGVVQLLLPLVLVALAVWNYFVSWPTTANGLLLIVGTTTIGVILGCLAGALTRVWTKRGVVVAQATALAAAAWILGMGARLVFQIWANSAPGLTQLIAISTHHRIESSAWVDAILLMAVGQVVARTVLLYVRGRRVRHLLAVTAWEPSAALANND